MKTPKEIVNRKATYQYDFIQEYEAGMLLQGTEVKSLRLGNANMTDAYCLFEGSELYVRNLFIGEYEQGNIHNHEPKRKRKLLLRKTELRKLERRVKEKGYTIVPYRIFFSERGIAKLYIALAQGKKTYSKKLTIKERDMQRELDRVRKDY